MDLGFTVAYHVAMSASLRVLVTSGVVALATPAVAYASNADASPDFACPTTSVFSDQITVTLGNGFTDLAIRTGACTGASQVGFKTGGSWAVKDATHGELVCNTTIGKETDVWYQEASSQNDWTRAGGTNHPDWTGNC